MAKYSVFNLFRKVKSPSVPFDSLYYPYALLIMGKAPGQKLCKGALSVVTEGGMA